MSKYQDKREPFYVRQRREEEEKRLRQDAASEYGYKPDENGHLVHDTSGQNKGRAPDPHPWLSGRAEERVEEENDPNKQLEARRLSALEYGFVDMNGHYVHLRDLPLQDPQDHGHQRTRKTLKPLPRQQSLSSGSLSSKPLSSSTYMVCTQLNPRNHDLSSRVTCDDSRSTHATINVMTAPSYPCSVRSVR